MANQVSDYIHSPFTLVTSAKFAAPWQFILTRSDGAGLLPAEPEKIDTSFKLVHFNIGTLSFLTSVTIKVIDGDVDNPIVTIFSLPKFGGGFHAPAVFNSISYSAGDNKWTIDMEPSPDEPGGPPGNPCLNTADQGENYFVTVSAMKTAHTLLNAITGAAIPTSQGTTASARSGTYDGTLTVNSNMNGQILSNDGDGGFTHRTKEGLDGTQGSPVSPLTEINHLNDADGNERKLGTVFQLLCNEPSPGTETAKVVPGLYIIEMPYFKITPALRFAVTTTHLEHRLVIETDQAYFVTPAANNLSPYEGTDQNGQNLDDIDFGANAYNNSLGRNFSPTVQAIFTEEHNIDPDIDTTGFDLTATNETSNFEQKRTVFGGPNHIFNFQFPSLIIGTS